MPDQTDRDPPAMRARLLPAIFHSLASSPSRWSLRRTLHSSNPNDIHGTLHGAAGFTPLSSSTQIPFQSQPQPQPQPLSPSQSSDTDNKSDGPGKEFIDALYHEQGTLPASSGPLAGMTFSKKYIWRLSAQTGKVSVWFAKASSNATAKNKENAKEKESQGMEADYLFHDFDVEVQDSKNANANTNTNASAADSEKFVTAPSPPMLGLPAGEEKLQKEETTVVTARGNHLCINDMYRTAYAFRVRAETGEVVSWTSRHVVKGPRKDQDIVNVYTRD